ncbi:MAG: hypothetical protein IT473_09060 [Lysobacter sp.]|nr:hypothetical protein [Lysobacter sp.]
MSASRTSGADTAAGETRERFPRAEWIGLAWLLVYLPAYQTAYGVRNFLFLCNIGVILTAAGLIARNRLLLSSQAVAAPVIALAWALDVGWKLATGDFLYGATEYMWDTASPLYARLLSLYHLGWPLLLWWVLRRIGYDPRGWPLQAVIAALAMIAGRWLAPAAENINFAWTDPFWGRQLGPTPVHLLVCWGVLTVVAYGGTHALLRRAFPRPR